MISRLQVLERTVPDSGDALHRDWARRGIHDGSLQAANYEQLLVGGRRIHPGPRVLRRRHRRRPPGRLRDPAGRRRPSRRCRGGRPREIDKVADGLKSAGVRVEGWCPPRLLGEIIRTAYDPASRPLIQRRGGADSDFRGGDDGSAVRGRPGDLRADAGGEQLVPLPHRHRRAPVLVDPAVAAPVRRRRLPVAAAAVVAVPAHRLPGAWNR